MDNLEEFARFLEDTDNAELAAEMQGLRARPIAATHAQPVTANSPMKTYSNPFDVPAMLKVAANSVISQGELLQRINTELKEGQTNHTYYRLPTELILSKI